MIAAQPGWLVCYEHEYKDKQVRSCMLEVVAWDDEGRAMVVSEKTGRLERASDLGRVVGLTKNEISRRLTAIMPADGWRVEYTDSDGSRYSQPLIGFAITTRGWIVGVDVDADGLIDTVSDNGRVYHSDGDLQIEGRQQTGEAS